MPNLATHIVVLTLPSPEVAISGLVLLSIVPLLSSYKKLTDRCGSFEIYMSFNALECYILLNNFTYIKISGDKYLINMTCFITFNWTLTFTNLSKNICQKWFAQKGMEMTDRSGREGPLAEWHVFTGLDKTTPCR